MYLRVTQAPGGSDALAIVSLVVVGLRTNRQQLLHHSQVQAGLSMKWHKLVIRGV